MAKKREETLAEARVKARKKFTEEHKSLYKTVKTKRAKSR